MEFASATSPLHRTKSLGKQSSSEDLHSASSL